MGLFKLKAWKTRALLLARMRPPLSPRWSNWTLGTADWSLLTSGLHAGRNRSTLREFWGAYLSFARRTTSSISFCGDLAFYCDLS